MTDTAYFITGILILLVVNLFILQRINRESYLHTPLRMPRFRFWRDDETIEHPTATPSVQRGRNAKATVDWFTSRNPAGQKHRVMKSDKPLSSPYRPKEREEEVFVGMAIVDEQKQSDKPEKPKGNVERWYKQASSQ